MNSTPKKRQADWIAAQNFIRFRALLDSEMDDRKCKILSQLLADEFDKFEKPGAPLSGLRGALSF